MINWINQIKEILKEINGQLKYLILVIIALGTFILIIFNRNGFDFGIISLFCWIFAFLDLARIKFKDYEIDFMTQKQVLTTDERNMFLDNYELVNSFIREFMRVGHVNDQALDYIQKAFDDAWLKMPKEIVEYTKMWATKARDAYILHNSIESEKDREARKKLIDKEMKITNEVFKMQPVEIYRKYIKISEDCAKV